MLLVSYDLSSVAPPRSVISAGMTGQLSAMQKKNKAAATKLGALHLAAADNDVLLDEINRREALEYDELEEDSSDEESDEEDTSEEDEEGEDAE